MRLAGLFLGLAWCAALNLAQNVTVPNATLLKNVVKARGSLAKAAVGRVLFFSFSISADSLSSRAGGGDFVGHDDRFCITPPPFGRQCTMHVKDAVRACVALLGCVGLVCPDPKPYARGQPQRHIRGPVCQARGHLKPDEKRHDMCKPHGCALISLGVRGPASSIARSPSKGSSSIRGYGPFAARRAAQRRLGGSGHHRRQGAGPLRHVPKSERAPTLDRARGGAARGLGRTIFPSRKLPSLQTPQRKRAPGPAAARACETPRRRRGARRAPGAAATRRAARRRRHQCAAAAGRAGRAATTTAGALDAARRGRAQRGCTAGPRGMAPRGMSCRPKKGLF